MTATVGVVAVTDAAVAAAVAVSRAVGTVDEVDDAIVTNYISIGGLIVKQVILPKTVRDTKLSMMQLFSAPHFSWSESQS